MTKVIRTQKLNKPSYHRVDPALVKMFLTTMIAGISAYVNGYIGGYANVTIICGVAIAVLGCINGHLSKQPEFMKQDQDRRH